MVDIFCNIHLQLGLLESAVVMDVKTVPGLELVKMITIQTTLVFHKSYPHHTYTDVCMCTCQTKKTTG